MNHPEGILISDNETRSSDTKSEGTTKKKSKEVAAKLINNEINPDIEAKEKRFLDIFRSKDRDIEARQVHNSAPVTENLGKIVIATETSTSSRTLERKRLKMSESKIKERNEDKSRKRIASLELQPSKTQTLAREELLAVSQKIKVEGTNLKKVYETHLIGEQALRRLVNEYLRGGDVQEALRKEIVERQIDFERDPYLRDLPSDSGALIGSDSTSDRALVNMIDRATASLNSYDDEVFLYGSDNKDDKKQRELALKKQHTTDIVIIGTIAFLTLIVLTIYLTRH